MGHQGLRSLGPELHSLPRLVSGIDFGCCRRAPSDNAISAVTRKRWTEQEDLWPHPRSANGRDQATARPCTDAQTQRRKQGLPEETA